MGRWRHLSGAFQAETAGAKALRNERAWRVQEPKKQADRGESLSWSPTAGFCEPGQKFGFYSKGQWAPLRSFTEGWQDCFLFCKGRVCFSATWWSAFQKLLESWASAGMWWRHLAASHKPPNLGKCTKMVGVRCTARFDGRIVLGANKNRLFY